MTFLVNNCNQFVKVVLSSISIFSTGPNCDSNCSICWGEEPKKTIKSIILDPSYISDWVNHSFFGQTKNLEWVKPQIFQKKGSQPKNHFALLCQSHIWLWRYHRGRWRQHKGFGGSIYRGRWSDGAELGGDYVYCVIIPPWYHHRSLHSLNTSAHWSPISRMPRLDSYSGTSWSTLDTQRAPLHKGHSEYLSIRIVHMMHTWFNFADIFSISFYVSHGTPLKHWAWNIWAYSCTLTHTHTAKV